MSIAQKKQPYASWLREMTDWTAAQLKATAEDEAAPVAKRQAARKHLRAMDPKFTASGKPIAQEELEQIIDRLEGKPESSPSVVVNVGPQINVTTEQMLDRIDEYLLGGSGSFRIEPVPPAAGPPADLRPMLPGPIDGEAPEQGPAGERPDPQAGAPGGQRE
jgi:hypothetical protein